MEMCDSKNSVSFFRPWNSDDEASADFHIKREFSDDDSDSDVEIERETQSMRSCSDYQPLDVLSDLVNQKVNEITLTRSSNSMPLHEKDNRKELKKAATSAFSPFQNLINSETGFLPNMQNYMAFPYNQDFLNAQGLIAMDCFNHYAAKLQGEVSLLQQQDLVAKQMKKLRPKKYKCEFCDNAFSNKGQLKGHTRIHTGERPYKCDNPSCGKTFTRNEELTRHKKIHTGDKPHKCPCCNKCFGRKDHLKKHAKTHEKGGFNYPPSYQYGAIPYIPAHALPPPPSIAVPYIYPLM